MAEVSEKKRSRHGKSRAYKEVFERTIHGNEWKWTNEQMKVDEWMSAGTKGGREGGREGRKEKGMKEGRKERMTCHETKWSGHEMAMEWEPKGDGMEWVARMQLINLKWMTWMKWMTGMKREMNDMNEINKMKGRK